ncbi:hypothetical protein ACFVTC_42255 [Streptomyces sp. NPDC057950]|uniref:hypothetical protein n=1 Tax=Streptomyces sp. NPDC057950 TaxID=3346288 RepID=UPI0036E1CAB8
MKHVLRLGICAAAVLAPAFATASGSQAVAAPTAVNADFTCQSLDFVDKPFIPPVAFGTNYTGVISGTTSQTITDGTHTYSCGYYEFARASLLVGVDCW